MVKEYPFATEASPRLLALATTAAALLLFFLSIPLHAAAEEQHNWITVGNASSSCDTAINAVNGNAVGGGGGGEGGGCVSLTLSHSQPDLEGWFEMASDMVGSAVLGRRRLDGTNQIVTAKVGTPGDAACDRNKYGLYISCTTYESVKRNPQKCDPFTRGCH